MTESSQAQREKLRYGIEDAVIRALEGGLSHQDVRTEVDYAIETFEDEARSGA